MDDKLLAKVKYQLKNLKPAERIPQWVVDEIFNHIDELQEKVTRLKSQLEEKDYEIASAYERMLDDED